MKKNNYVEYWSNASKKSKIMIVVGTVFCSKQQFKKTIDESPFALTNSLYFKQLIREIRQHQTELQQNATPKEHASGVCWNIGSNDANEEPEFQHDFNIKYTPPPIPSKPHVPPDVTTFKNPGRAKTKPVVIEPGQNGLTPVINTTVPLKKMPSKASARSTKSQPPSLNATPRNTVYKRIHTWSLTVTRGNFRRPSRPIGPQQKTKTKLKPESPKCPSHYNLRRGKRYNSFIFGVLLGGGPEPINHLIILA